MAIKLPMITIRRLITLKTCSITIDDNVSAYRVLWYLFNAYNRTVSPARAIVNKLRVRAETTGKANVFMGR
jgi:hypothetical protein